MVSQVISCDFSVEALQRPGEFYRKPGHFVPIQDFTGICIAIIRRTDDNEDKLVVVPSGRDYTDEQIMALVEVQERFYYESKLSISN